MTELYNLEYKIYEDMFDTCHFFTIENLNEQQMMTIVKSLRLLHPGILIYAYNLEGVIQYIW